MTTLSILQDNKVAFLTRNMERIHTQLVEAAMRDESNLLAAQREIERHNKELTARAAPLSTATKPQLTLTDQWAEQINSRSR